LLNYVDRHLLCRLAKDLCDSCYITTSRLWFCCCSYVALHFSGFCTTPCCSKQLSSFIHCLSVFYCQSAVPKTLYSYGSLMRFSCFPEVFETLFGRNYSQTTFSLLRMVHIACSCIVEQ